MKERFYGPWRVELVRVTNLIQSRVTITGSSNADGAYDLYQNQPLTMMIDGPDWAIAVESWWPEVGFSERPIRRSNSFDREAGLIAMIEMGTPPGGGIGPAYEFVQLRCISQDPNVNPNPEPNPFDFTLPER